MFQPRTRRFLVVAAATAAALTTMATHASAQSSKKWSLQGSGIFVGVSGDAFEGLSSGPGGELQIRFTPGRLSIGLGGQYSLHKIDLGGGDKRDVDFSGAFIEPRLVFDVGKDSFAPYLAARLAYLQQALTLTADELGTAADVDLTASGSQINGGGGVLFRMSPRVNLDLGATIGFIRFDDVKAKSGSVTVPVEGTSGNGQNLVFRLGLAIGLGK